jgi:hypothetical protein
MGSFHDILEEEHRKFAESLDGQEFFKLLSEMEQSSKYVLVEKQLLEDIKDFDYWKEWKDKN